LFSPPAIAAAFVAARSSGQSLSGFPGGAIPEDLAFSYQCQDAAIALWPDEIVGWKVGGVPPHLWDKLGVTRVVGPIFKKSLHTNIFPVFAGGFAAVEAEFTMVIGRDAPADRLDWTVEQARDLVGAIHLSIETAGSPLASINNLGPTVVASDFGNNAGVILGPALPDWQNSNFEQIVSRTLIDGAEVGSGNALTLSGGPFESLRVLLENCARRGRPLKAGTLAATGAITGVHDIAAGQTARVEFGPFGAIECRAEPFGV
jgi:2-keto-4-pentenoate hydratase